MNPHQLNRFFASVLSLTLFQVLATGNLSEAAENPKQSVLLAAPEPSTKPEVFGQGVRETKWQTPEQELRGFHLPDGFEVRLFASEPMIAKPMNLAFDNRNRLWLTQTVEYPYPATKGTSPRDAVMILEDIDGDGSADRSIKFADNLNIPIGILPFGEGCLCFSIPNILYLRDTDGDGRCDRRDVILGPFDTTRDTHGMVNALRDGGDGWIYACHGFNNQSQVKGTDGHQITMHSGNTFRFRPDGSRVEHVTHGQVNPFGLTRDEWGYRYSADCHSKPITQLILSAYYPSFGRPHDGLGFLPPMLDHLHGSTAICGIASYPSDSMIPVLRNQMLSGNVMTSRINRNQVTYVGATARGEAQPDFMTSDDPWFRPVDLQIGLDSHLYVADFYNKIIGHYEVSLQHPERDRHSGRIWQIRWHHTADKTNTSQELLDKRYVDDGISQQIDKLHKRSQNGSVKPDELVKLIETAPPQVAVAALRLVIECTDPEAVKAINESGLLLTTLSNSNAHLSQVAAEALGQKGKTSDIPHLIAQLQRVPPSDVVLRQTIRIAIRNLFQHAEANDPIWETEVNAEIASIYLGLERSELATGLLEFLHRNPDTENRNTLLTHAIKLAPPSALGLCITIADQLTHGAPGHREELIRQLLASNVTSDTLPNELRDWIYRHVKDQFQSVRFSERIVGWHITGGGEWPYETRKRDGGGELEIESSLGRGETYVGEKVSDEFIAPERIGFWLAGHNGFPDQDSHFKNRVQLVRSSDSMVLREAFPPRSDIAVPIQWDLQDWKGESVQLKIIDKDDDTAYAWLGVGDFEPKWIGESKSWNSIRSSLKFIEQVQLTEAEKELQSLLKSKSISKNIKFSIAGTLARLSDQHAEATLLQYASAVHLPSDISNVMIDHKFYSGEQNLYPVVNAICKGLTQFQQTELSQSWIKNGAPIESLIHFAERGLLNPRAIATPEIGQLIKAKQKALAGRHHELTQHLEIDQERDHRLRQLQSQVKLASFDPAKGEALFTRHCINCHQLNGTGKVVGPQLDGAVTRSVERLLEDIVTPNRNVDHAFRTTNLLLEDGRLVSGLMTSEDEKWIHLADPAGKPIHISVSEILQRQVSEQSLMPSNFSELITAKEFSHLIGFLKSE